MQTKQILTICQSIDATNDAIATLDNIMHNTTPIPPQYMPLRVQLLAELVNLRTSLTV